MKHYGGIYRAQIVNSEDPENRGRLQVRVPAIHGLSAALWADPCSLPLDGGVGPSQPEVWYHTHSLVGGSGPEVGGVWVMFEAGDPGKPVWMGVWQ